MTAPVRLTKSPAVGSVVPLSDNPLHLSYSEIITWYGSSVDLFD